MIEYPQETIEPLGSATVVLQPGDEKRRFRITAATIKMLPRRRVQLGFEGPKGSITADVSLGTVWHLMALMMEQVVVVEDDAESVDLRGRRSRPAKARQPQTNEAGTDQSTE